MPKKPVDSLQGFRIELNEKERDALALVSTSMAIRNVGQGVGAVAKPVLDNLAVIIAAIVAMEGADFLENKAKEWSDNRVRNQRQYELDAYNEYLEAHRRLTPGEPIMTEEEYTRTVTQESTAYKRAAGWQRRVGDPIRNGLAGLADAVTFWD